MLCYPAARNRTETTHVKYFHELPHPYLYQGIFLRLPANIVKLTYLIYICNTDPTLEGKFSVPRDYKMVSGQNDENLTEVG